MVCDNRADAEERAKPENRAHCAAAWDARLGEGHIMLAVVVSGVVGVAEIREGALRIRAVCWKAPRRLLVPA